VLQQQFACHGLINKIFCLIVLCSAALFSQSLLAGPLDRFERLVMPGELSTAHEKYKKDCDQCHKPFEKGAQNDLCLDCHKKVNQDVMKQKGLHGKIPKIEQINCSHCHAEHRGQDANIVPFDRDTFDHNRTDFPLQGTHDRLVCSSCHKKTEKYRKAASDCYGCHKKDDSHKGRMGKKCQNCHIELFWGESYYNHKKTDFPLKATHKNVRCIDCHPNQQFKDTSKTCYACHEFDDVHRSDNGKKCEDCHNEKAWEIIVFDHDKDTKFKLKARHQSISCQACHKGDVYKDIKHDCITCHEGDDSHQGFFGKKCQDCHVEKSWSRNTFDHTKETDYPLKGKHRTVECILCHKGDVYAELDDKCISCHRKDDSHEGEEGEKCENCHNVDGWDGNVLFDHGLTAFPLLGIHAITPCEECHLTSVFQQAELRCKSCHMKDDKEIHRKRLTTNCELCHNSNDWKAWFFNHDTQTDYKLDGAHKNLDCHACHTVAVEKEIEHDQKCISCHERDDYHNGSFGSDCERCHVTSSFKKIKLLN